jgi:hypothetical protein
MTGRILTAMMMDDDDIEDDEEELRRRIPQGNSPFRRGRWAEAYHWVSWLLSIFDDLNELRLKGINRTTGLRLANWLWGIEGAVRRLILAAALAMDVKDLRKAGAKRAHGAKPPRPSNTRPVFRVFCLRRSGQTPSPQPQVNSSATAEPRPYGHIPYPSDPLLSLGEKRQQAPRTLGRSRQRNPLDRWVRLSRQDPDYHLGRSDEDVRRQRASAPSSPRQREKKERAPYSPFALPESLYDWRRVHDEWEKIVPAPSFAARIFALQRIVADPEALIARTAQRLQSIRDQVTSLVRHALPLLRQSRRDKTRPSSETGLLAARCHGAIFRPDTS